MKFTVRAGFRRLHILAAAILALVPLHYHQACAQQKNVFEMSPQERAKFMARINEDSWKNWQAMVKMLQVAVPDSLPSPSVDPRRPAGTFQKAGSSNWYDSAGNTYVRSAWGTWNNYDERLANPYTVLPDPLRLDNGEPVKDPETWRKERRQQLLKHFDEEIYGRAPDQTPPVRWEVVSRSDTTVGTIPVLTRKLLGHVDNSTDTAIHVDIQVTLTTPSRLSRPVPVIMELGFVFPPGFRFPGMQNPSGPTWQEQVLAKGWGYAIYVPTSVQPDNAAGLTGGIIGLVNGGKLPRPDDWGALRAWAWGASRVLDFFETDKTVDARKVAIEGVSRYGKAVLVAMAYDPRFAMVLVGSSGKGGATFFRRDYGESMGNICSSGEYHWFAGNFLRHAVTPNGLSVDSHELIALCAPRPVFISCGSPEVEGRWVDDRGQFMAAAAAGPVYELLGGKGLGTTVLPAVGTPLLDGALAFRQHEGGHTVGPNWPFFLSFAQRYFEPAPGTR